MIIKSQGMGFCNVYCQPSPRSGLRWGFGFGSGPFTSVTRGRRGLLRAQQESTILGPHLSWVLRTCADLLSAPSSLVPTQIQAARALTTALLSGETKKVQRSCASMSFSGWLKS